MCNDADNKFAYELSAVISISHWNSAILFQSWQYDDVA